jgi:hypothetical protein
VELFTDEKASLRSLAEQIFEKYSPKQLKINDKKRRVEVEKSVIKLSELMELLLSFKDKLIKDFNIDEPKFEDVYLQVTVDDSIDDQSDAQNGVQLGDEFINP